jgi:hypothetical protein
VDVSFEMRREAGDLRALLRAEGWMLDEGGATRVTARHPQVTDQETARTRLLEMGLLTSSRFRIEIGLPGD